MGFRRAWHFWTQYGTQLHLFWATFLLSDQHQKVFGGLATAKEKEIVDIYLLLERTNERTNERSTEQCSIGLSYTYNGLLSQTTYSTYQNRNAPLKIINGPLK